MCHQGLGDHILCSGIYREYAKKYDKCIIPVMPKYRLTLREFFKDTENIETTISENYRIHG